MSTTPTELPASSSTPDEQPELNYHEHFANFPSEQSIKSALYLRMNEFQEDHSQDFSEALKAARLAPRPPPHPCGIPPAQDPFASLQPIERSKDLKAWSVTAELPTGKICKKVKPVTTTYSASVDQVPPHIYYTTSNVDIVTQNDTELRSYPELMQKDSTEKLEKELLKRYDDCNPETRRKHLPEVAKMRQLLPYLFKFFKDAGVSPLAVMHFLLRPHLKVYNGMPKTIRECWTDRKRFCSKKLPPDSEELAEDVRRISKPTDRDMLMACFSCKLIKEVCDLRLYPAIEEVIMSQSIGDGNQTNVVNGRAEKPHALSSLAFHDNFQCSICFTHECLEHGDIQELADDTPTDTESIESDTQPDDPSEGDSNFRTRILNNVEAPVKKRKLLASSFTEISELDCGLTDDGTLRGAHEVDDMDSAVPDSSLCSLDCFWKISSRQTGDAGEWTDQETELLKSFLPGMAEDKRAPCALNTALGHTCVEVFHKSVELTAAGLGTKAAGKSPPRKKTKRLTPTKRKQKNPTRDGSLDCSGKTAAREVFYPCDHEGSCEDARCSCFLNQVHCEKICNCSGDCKRRFLGCRCKQLGKACTDGNKCACVQWNRECDADLCGICGADELLDPMNLDKDIAADGKCCNVDFQRRRPKNTWFGRSHVVQNGNGLYAGEAIKEGQLIGEYTGEIITTEEADRRGEVYHATKNYLFRIGASLELDGNYIGNKIRLINHAGKAEFQNCICVNKLVDTRTRVGIFAKRDINLGEELFYDYGYASWEHLQDFYEKDGSRSWDHVVNKDHRAGGSASKGAEPEPSDDDEVHESESSNDHLMSGGLTSEDTTEEAEEAPPRRGLKRKATAPPPAETEDGGRRKSARKIKAIKRM